MNSDSIINKLKRSFRGSVIKSVVKVALKHKIRRLRTRSAVFIQKNIRGYFVRKDLYFIPHHKISMLVKWTFPAESVSIAGNFSNPPWEIQIPLKHSKFCNIFFTTYFLENRIDPGRYYIKFIVNGEWMCNSSMMMAEDMDGNYNNVLTIIKDKRYVPRAHSTRNLAPDVFSISKCIVPKTEIPRVSSVENNFLRPIKLKKPERHGAKLKLIFGHNLAAHPKTRFAPLDAQNTADAYFIDENLQIFGVADGVGEWETFGLDPGMFSKELMGHFKDEYISNTNTFKSINKEEICGVLKGFLEVAYNKTKSYGSSTVLLGVCHESLLYTLCLGDSGYVILRPRERGGKLMEVFRSIEQQHSFNCPYQLACFPDPSKYEKLSKQGLGSFVSLLKRSNLSMQDMPSDAQAEVFALEPKDVIIAASDGLFDNLFDEDLIKISEQFGSYDIEPEEFCNRLAKELVMKAIQKGWDNTYKSPFSKNAARFGQRYIGGKLDDTTVIVALALE